MPDLTLPGQPPPPLFFPPFPNEEKMRRGRLNAEAPLGLLGETHSVGRGLWPVILVGAPVELQLQRLPSHHQKRRMQVSIWRTAQTPTDKICVLLSPSYSIWIWI